MKELKLPITPTPAAKEILTLMNGEAPAVFKEVKCFFCKTRGIAEARVTDKEIVISAPCKHVLKSARPYPHSKTATIYYVWSKKLGFAVLPLNTAYYFGYRYASSRETNIHILGETEDVVIGFVLNEKEKLPFKDSFKIKDPVTLSFIEQRLRVAYKDNDFIWIFGRISDIWSLRED